MKTSPANSRKANFGRAILLIALVIALGSTGCQKEDELMPSANNSISQSEANASVLGNNNLNYYTLDKSVSIDEALAQISERALPVTNQSAVSSSGNLSAINVFNIIKIDHMAGASDLPDYTVIVRSDGWVVYDGHVNVRITDRIAFRISDATLPVLHGIFDRYSFNYIVSDFKVYSDMPVVYTTYQVNRLQRPRTIYDDYKNNPPKLILIRESVEEVLGIGRYVYDQWPVPLQEPSF